MKEQRTTTRFHPKPFNLPDVTTHLHFDPKHITLVSNDFVRRLFVLEGFRCHSDLEQRLDCGRRQLLVYERS